MRYIPEKHNRRSIRLRGYDYSKPGAYYVTICTENHDCLFGEIENGKMRLNESGEIIKNEWKNTRKIRPNVILDKYVIMPDHFHAIIIIEPELLDYPRINDNNSMERADRIRFRSPSKNLGAIIRGFKSATAKQINILRQTPGAPLWQRNYYEHILRNENDLNRIRTYIINNPSNWKKR